MDWDKIKKTQQQLLDAIPDGGEVEIEGLLTDVATKYEHSLQTVAVALWEALQWGRLDWRGSRVAKSASDSDDGGTPRPMDLESGRNCRDHDERQAGQARRSESRIDRDRILQSWAFRRLEGVTQVVTPDHSGHLMHSRLVHSLKVGQVGRRIADELLARGLDTRVFARGGGLDPEVVEAAGFAHDIGHPPFGHTGERVLDEWAKRKMVADGFEGNAQTLRALTRLEYRFSSTQGLNLTNATLAAVIKYPWSRSGRSGDKKYQKFNAYSDDVPVLEAARRALGVTTDEQTLEASIMDIADDITYALHDLEDFYTAGLFRRNHIAAILGDYADKQAGRAMPPTTDQYQDLVAKAKKIEADYPQRFDSVRFNHAVERVMVLVRFSMYRHFDGSRDAFALIRTAFASRIDAYITKIELKDVTGSVIAWLDDDHWHEIQVLKWLTRDFVISRSELALEQLGQVRLMEKTLDKLFEWCVAASPVPVELPCADCSGTKVVQKAVLAISQKPPITLYASVVAADGDGKALVRGILDYVASLTDEQLIALAKTLAGDAPPSSLYTV